MTRPTIHQGDVLTWAAQYDGEPFHALLCDPPYELGFMGRAWDNSGIAFRPETWAAFLPLLHPGAFGMAFAGSRGWHRMAVAIEDAGFIIHPTMFGWSYGSGFPKATRIDTQIDKAAGAEREVLGKNRYAGRQTKPLAVGGVNGLFRWGDQHLPWDDLPPNAQEYFSKSTDRRQLEFAPATPLAQTWAGHRYGLQALKPALEPIIVFQKPYTGRPVDSITRTGAGALWIDGGRIGTEQVEQGRGGRTMRDTGIYGRIAGQDEQLTASGRWPSNLVLVHAPTCGDTCDPGCPVERLGAQSGERPSRAGATKPTSNNSWFTGEYPDSAAYGDDTGTAARFFFHADYALDRLEAADPVVYVAKASTAEREAGLSRRQKRKMRPDGNEWGTTSLWNGQNGDEEWRNKNPQHPRANTHPTIKPISLAQHLATLLLPPAAYAPRRLFVPFAGAGSETIAAMMAGWEEIEGVELDAEHVEIARARIDYWAERGWQVSLFDQEAV